MIRLVYGADANVHDFVRSTYGRSDIEFQGSATIGVSDDGTLIAGVIFHDWQPSAGTIEMSIAARSARWMTRPVMAALAKYVIEGAKAQLVVMRTSESNTRACRIAEGLGFTAHRVPRLRGRDDAEMIYTMAAEDLAENPFMRAR